MSEKATPGTVETVQPYQWSARLLADPRVTRSTLLVAFVLAAHGKPTPDSPVWPSRGRVAGEAGIAQGTVSVALTKLRDLGYLTEADRRAYAAAGHVGIAQGDQRVKAWLLTTRSVGSPDTN